MELTMSFGWLYQDGKCIILELEKNVQSKLQFRIFHRQFIPCFLPSLYMYFDQNGQSPVATKKVSADECIIDTSYSLC